MKKLILAPALALAIGAGTTTPAYANPASDEAGYFSAGSNPFAILIGMLLPAVQKVR